MLGNMNVCCEKFMEEVLEVIQWVMVHTKVTSFVVWNFGAYTDLGVSGLQRK